jgi:hypothetical protein
LHGSDHRNSLCFWRCHLCKWLHIRCCDRKEQIDCRFVRSGLWFTSFSFREEWLGMEQNRTERCGLEWIKQICGWRNRLRTEWQPVQEGSFRCFECWCSIVDGRRSKWFGCFCLRNMKWCLMITGIIENMNEEVKNCQKILVHWIELEWIELMTMGWNLSDFWSD